MEMSSKEVLKCLILIFFAEDDPKTKAIVFHFNEFNLDNIPKTRKNYQYYVWWTMESTRTLFQSLGDKLNFYDNFFNLTMTYRRDSDIFSFYGQASTSLRQAQQGSVGDFQADLDALLAKKSKLALWIVSNCGSTPGAKLRMNYVEEMLKAGLNLDRKGGCFPQFGPAKLEDIVKYKFYLSFENSLHCKDYITEKLFRNAFQMEAVPVILGARKSDYEAMVPPGSCIYADDFKSPQYLVDYLNYLDKNQTAYLSYMKWRTMKMDEMPMKDVTNGFCHLCRVLHGINIDNLYNRKSSELNSYIPLFGYPNRPRIVPSVKDWFYGQDYEECFV